MKHFSDAKLIYLILITTLVSCLARFLFFYDPRPEVSKKQKILFKIDLFYLNDTLDLDFTSKWTAHLNLSQFWNRRRTRTPPFTYIDRFQRKWRI